MRIINFQNIKVLLYRHLRYVLCFCALLVCNLSYAQEEVSLKDQIDQFDSLSYENKVNLVEQYVSSELNSNAVNLFILRFNEFYHFLSRDIYRKAFYNTSFNDTKFKEDSLFYLFKLHIYDAQIDSALNNYKKMQSQDNRNTAQAGLKLANYYSHLHDYKKALHYFNKSFHFDAKTFLETKGASPNYWKNVNRYFNLLRFNEQYETILTYADSILQHKPESESWLEKKADAEYHLGEYKAASITYKQIYQIDPSFKCVKNLLKVYNQLGDTTAIVSLLSENTKQRGTDDIESRHLLYNYLDCYGYDTLRDSLLYSVLERDTQDYESFLDSEALYYYSVFLTDDDQYRAAIKLLKEVAKIINHCYNAYPYERKIDRYSYNDVFNYYTLGEARNLYKSKYEYAIGWLYNEIGRKRKAFKYYKRALDYYECNVNAHYAIAKIYKSSIWRKREKATHHYEKIISCDLHGWSNYPAIAHVAESHYVNGELQQAKELLEPAISLGELKSREYYLLYQIYYSEKNYDAALLMLDRAIELEDNAEMIHLYNQFREAILELLEME